MNSTNKEPETPLFQVNVWLHTNRGNFEGAVQGDFEKANFTARNGALNIPGKIEIVPAKGEGGQSARHTIFKPDSPDYPNILIEEGLNHSIRG